jgi:hypothetical protein
MHKVEHDSNRTFKIEGKLESDNLQHDRFVVVTSDNKVSELIQVLSVLPDTTAVP